jgi:glutamate-ammonia-ligase adenylyltransferase
LIVRVMTFGPRVARTLARRPAALDALLDSSFFSPLADIEEIGIGADPREDFESAMNRARRAHRERDFRISVQVLAGVASAREAGFAFANLADSLIEMLARASMIEVERKAGAFRGDVAVVALGKCGSREMTARSDLDLMTLYRPFSESTASEISGISAETFYARFTQRLVAALSAPTSEGELYEVDLQLRPSGTKGPVAVSFSSFESYYDHEAEVWELLALTRARIVWSSSPEFAAEASRAIESVLRRPRERLATAIEVREMRALMSRERPTTGFWDMKLSEGGLVDIEFAAQYLQLVKAYAGGPLRQNTGEALTLLVHAEPESARSLEKLRRAWDLQQNLSQLLKVALPDEANPEDEPPALQAMLAKAGRATSIARLRTKLVSAREEAHRAFQHLV